MKLALVLRATALCILAGSVAAVTWEKLDFAATRGDPFMIRNKKWSDKCLSVSFTDRFWYLKMEQCDEDNPKQFWIYEQGKEGVRNSAVTGAYLNTPKAGDWQMDHPDILWWGGWENSDNFKVYSDSKGRLHSRGPGWGDGKCLFWNTERSVKDNGHTGPLPTKWDCNDESDEQYEMFARHPTPSPSKAPTAAPSKAPTKAPSDSPTASVPASLPASMSGSGGSTGTSAAGAGGSASGASPLGTTGSASGDPHFKMFGGKKFDFHGGCDLVLLQNPSFSNGLGLSVHIRTRIETWWSYIEVAVVQIGDQLLELMGGPEGEGPHYRVNGVAGDEENVEKDPNLMALVKTLETHLNGFKIIYTKVGSKQHKFRINLNHAGDAISLETYKDWVTVNVKANKAENFQGAKGLMGVHPSGAMMSRNGKKIIDPVAFGKEWQVIDTEPMLFHEAKGVQCPEECTMPTSDASAGRKKRRLGESLITEEAAAFACAHADCDNKDSCIYDVLATNDMDMAGAY